MTAESSPLLPVTHCTTCCGIAVHTCRLSECYLQDQVLAARHCLGLGKWHECGWFRRPGKNSYQRRSRSSLHCREQKRHLSWRARLQTLHRTTFSEGPFGTRARGRLLIKTTPVAIDNICLYGGHIRGLAAVCDLQHVCTRQSYSLS